MALADYGKIGVFVVDRINQVSGWLKGKNRRKDVQTMEGAINSGDNATVNSKLNKLHNDVKNKADSK
jgi:hypothetical protein